MKIYTVVEENLRDGVPLSYCPGLVCADSFEEAAEKVTKAFDPNLPREVTENSLTTGLTYKIPAFGGLPEVRGHMCSTPTRFLGNTPGQFENPHSIL